MFKPILGALLVLALTAPARAEEPPDARALLQRVVDAYRALSTYRMSGVLSTRMVGFGMNLDVPWSSAGDRTGRAHVETQDSQGRVLVVSDGKQIYTFRPALNQYTLLTTSGPDSTSVPPPLAASPLMRYRNVFEGLEDAQVTGAEAITIAGQTADCWVVRCHVMLPQMLAADSTAQATSTFWVDKVSSYVRRDSTSYNMINPHSGQHVTLQQLTTFDLLGVDETLPDSLFTFVAPAGAKKVKAFPPSAGQTRKKPSAGVR